MITLTMPIVHRYHRPNKQIFPVTVYCSHCQNMEEIDAEFLNDKMVRIVRTRHFASQGGEIYCHCGNPHPLRVFLPGFLKF